ncbi:MAG: 30S ribosomal protein S15 [Candidatus Neomarinimicrobiota bacterium]|nr:30S ribosomal protein S15 [Candidatus Neomarinimicrobiota bacterium]
MPISKDEKQEIVKKIGNNDLDTGSPEVQIAILTHRIRELTDPVKVHKKDNHTRRGLVQLVSKRKRLLKYLVRKNVDSYVNLIKELGIRG